jgi:hypothetical protein
MAAFKRSSGKWIQGAHLRKGSFTKQATAAGMGVQAYAAKVLKPGSKASALTKRRANLARTFKKMAK